VARWQAAGYVKATLRNVAITLKSSVRVVGYVLVKAGQVAAAGRWETAWQTGVGAKLWYGRLSHVKAGRRRAQVYNRHRPTQRYEVLKARFTCR